MGENDKESLSDSGDMEDITWEDASADLDQQRDMLKNAAAGGASENADLTQTSPAPEAPVQREPEMPENIDRILDIPLSVIVELGKTRMLINDLLQLGQGSVIELTKLVGEPLEVHVNNKILARGEVVVINEKFGIRLTEIVSASERIASLK